MWSRRLRADTTGSNGVVRIREDGRIQLASVMASAIDVLHNEHASRHATITIRLPA